MQRTRLRRRSLCAPVASEYDGVTGAVTVTVKDLDEKGILLNPLSLELEEGGPGRHVYRGAPVCAHLERDGHHHGAGSGGYAEPGVVDLHARNLGRTPQTITIQAPEDEDTDNEQFTLTHRARGGGYDNETAHLEVRILDRGDVLLSIYDARVLEEDGYVDLRVELNRPANQLVSVMYRAVPEEAEAGSDYEDSRGIVVFGSGSTNGKIRLNILEDEIAESDETFTVVLSNARHAVIARGTGRVTIVEDQAGVTVRIDDGEAFEQDGRVKFTVHLSQPSADPGRGQLSNRERNGDRRRGLCGCERGAHICAGGGAGGDCGGAFDR